PPFRSAPALSHSSLPSAPTLILTLSLHDALPIWRHFRLHHLRLLRGGDRQPGRDQQTALQDGSAARRTLGHSNTAAPVIPGTAVFLCFLIGVAKTAAAKRQCRPRQHKRRPPNDNAGPGNTNGGRQTELPATVTKTAAAKRQCRPR